MSILDLGTPAAGVAGPRRKQAIRDLMDRLAPERARWIARNRYFYDEDIRYMRFLVPPGARVLDLGCGTGELLAALEPVYGLGVDFSVRMVDEARRRHPQLEFRVGDIEDPEVIRSLGGPFDYIIVSDTIGSLDDCEATLASLHALCERRTRLVIAYYSHLWEPVLKLAERLGLKMPQPPQNYLSTDDIRALMDLADFEMVKREWRQLVPRKLLGIGSLVNRYVGSLPGVRRASLRHYLVARSMRRRDGLRSATVVVPCRNERGNIEPAVTRLPRFCGDIEVIFVEGHSRDGTLEECHRVRAAHAELDIKVMMQDGTGKADAVFKAFDHARGDVLMILDADLTVPPEQLPKFWHAIATGKGEFVNGSRLVYPFDSQEAMRLLNHIANRVFSMLFTWLLNQRFTDTLCGTKALRREDYERLKAGRVYFGDFDPFGDFDLIFGASKLGLKTVEVPIRYTSRTYGETQISRFRHGWLLLRMVVFAFRRLKAL